MSLVFGSVREGEGQLGRMRASPAARTAGVATPVRPVRTMRAVHARNVSQKAEKKGGFGLFEQLGTQLAQAGSQLTESLTGTVSVQRNVPRKGNVVFVAGATGRLGSKIVMEAARGGSSVRAACRSEEKAEALREALGEQLERAELNRVDFVLCDVNDASTLAPAIGAAGALLRLLCQLDCTAGPHSPLASKLQFFALPVMLL